MLRKLLLVLLPVICVELSAQVSTSAGTPAAACGPHDQTYVGHTSEKAEDIAPPPGMATLVLVEDDLQQRPGHAACLKCSTRLQLGADGNWIAATEGFSHASATLAPGDHHFCAAAGASALVPAQLSFIDLHVEAGKVYFLQARVSYFYGYNVKVLDLSQLNDSQGQYMVSLTRQRRVSKR